jgi:hypothetical protein
MHLHRPSFQESPSPASAGPFIPAAAVARWPAARITLRQGIRVDQRKESEFSREKTLRTLLTAETLAQSSLIQRVPKA